MLSPCLFFKLVPSLCMSDVVYEMRQTTLAHLFEKLNPLSDADININRCPAGAAPIHTHLGASVLLSRRRRDTSDVTKCTQLEFGASLETGILHPSSLNYGHILVTVTKWQTY